MLSITLPHFSGTPEALLALVERRAIEVTSVMVAEVAGQCLIELRREGPSDPGAVAEFVALCARLMLLKSAALLPRPAVQPVFEDDETDAEVLAELLQEYQRYKLAAAAFRSREAEGLRSFPRLVPPPPLPPRPGLSAVTLDQLARLVREALGRLPPDPPPAVAVYTITIRGQITALADLLSQYGRLQFSAFIAAARSRMEVVVSFMAVLELIKSGRVIAEQDVPFGDIAIVALDHVHAAGLASD